MRRGILLLFGFLLPLLSPGQQLPIRSYTVADGLAEDRVNAIVQDSRGYIWIATSGGLSRFDGYQMKTYGTADGLPSRSVNSLIEPPSGAYLIGSSRGLCRLENRGLQAFTAWPLERQTPSVDVLLTEPSGRILLGSSIGLFESVFLNSGGDTTFRRLPLEAAAGTRVLALARDSGGNLWISTSTALEILGPAGAVAVLQPGRGLPATVGHAAAMLEQPAGRMWVATNVGLALFLRDSAGQWRLHKTFNTADGLVGNDIAGMATDSEGRLWLATLEGISQFAPEGPLPPRFQNLGTAQGLTSRLITALAKDAAGNMWVGTENAGVMRIARDGFVTYRQENGLKFGHVLQVLADRAGELLTVTQDSERRSVEIFDGTGFRSITPPALSRSNWAWQRILLQARNGDWWTGTARDLFRFPATKAPGLAYAQPVRYPREDVYHVFEDSRGGIWASGLEPWSEANLAPGAELARWDPGTRTRSWFCANGGTSLQPCVFGGLASAMAEDSRHNIWLGLYSGGLLRYTEGRFARLGDSAGVPPGEIFSLFNDARGRLWIGAAGGLALVADPSVSHPRFQLYNKARGLSSNSILCIADDAMGRIYLGTPRGVDRLDPETGHVRQFSAADGVPYGGFASAIRDRSGAVWFGSRTGVSRIVPEPPGDPHVPKVLITALQAGDVGYAISQLGETRIVASDLSPSKNRVQVDFVAPDASGETLRYKFKLTGADTAWSEPRAQHSVDYRNLAAGHYQFVVKAVDTEGRESSNTADVSFTVLPPMWKRWWFELCLFGVAVGLAYALHAYRLNNILAIERMRTAIATDLHDDIGSSLAQIAVWSEVAQVSAAGGAPQSSRPLARIATVARELTDSMNDIVWSIRSDDESLESLLRRMRRFSAEFLQPAGIDFSFTAAPAPPRVRLALNSRRQIFLIYKECMHNLVKHSGCRSAWAEFVVGDREAVMTVSDDGIGLNGYSGASRSLASGGGNGLPNMLRRAESMGGSAEWGARPGGGCRITVRLPVRRRAFGDSVL